MDRHQQQSIFPPINEDSTKLHQGLIPTTAGGGRLTGLIATEEMREKKGVLERGTDELLVDRDLLACHGWLAPSGELYPCAYKGHDRLAARLGSTHKEIEERGYIKLANLKWLVEARYRSKEVTDDQWKTIESWYERNGFPEAHLLRLITLVE